MKWFAHRIQTLSNYQFIVFMLVSVILAVIVVTATITSAEAGKISRTPYEKREFVESLGSKLSTGTETQRPTDRLVPAGFDCSRIRDLGIDKQVSMRAGAIMIHCGEAEGGAASPAGTSYQLLKKLLAPMMFGTSDVDLITGTETSPNVTQSTTFTAANPDNPNQIVVGYNDSRGVNANPINLGGASVSTDGGNTFTRLTKASGQSPFDNTFGDPVVLYNKQNSTWFTVWLDKACGGDGLGGYRSTTPGDPNSWTHFCAFVESSADRESGWADNNPSSPFYGRMYVSWNDFNVGGGALRIVRSTDNGFTWSSPTNVTATFIRDVQITGDLAGNGNIYIAGMDEGGGGFPHNDTNRLYKSTDGGVTWANTYTGPSFPGPGVSTCPGNTYYSCMFSDGGGYWRHEGGGEPAAYNNVVHLVYAQHGVSTDPGDVYYIRSTDGGVTFSAPLKLNTDATTRPQWEPNLSVSPSGTLLATWYDARESSNCTRGDPTVPCYRMWSRKSTDNGATWLANDTLSDVVSPLPAQPDPGLNSVYVSDYDYGSAIASKHFTSWVDGRIAIATVSQQDAFFDRVPTTSPTIQFNAANYPVGEVSGHVDTIVTRNGDTSGSASVSFSTSDLAGAQNCNVTNGVASSRCDYEARFATVKFGPGETSKTISVFIINDSYLEGTETFSVNLTNPSGASLGSPATATVTITDNDTATGSNPIDSADFFVKAHYLDFLNREADTSGLNFWVGNFTDCNGDLQCLAAKRVNVSAAFYLSIEFQQTGYLVERLYKVAFGDASGTSTLGGTHQLAVPIVRLNEFLLDTQQIGNGVVVGQTGWETVLENNKQAFAADFVQRARFTTAYANTLTPAQFVDHLFADAGVTPSAADRTAAINEFNGAGDSSNTAARAKALRDVAENATLTQLESNRAFVLMQYFGYLRRNPNDPQDTDYTGYDFWLTKLNQFNGDFAKAEMVKAFITSIEYRQRFGP